MSTDRIQQIEEINNLSEKIENSLSQENLSELVTITRNQDILDMQKIRDTKIDTLADLFSALK